MTLDIAMGGSTNTVLHLLAAAHEARDRLHHGRHRPAVAPRAGAVQGRALGRRRAYRGRAPRRRHHGHPRRTRPRRPAQPRRRDGPRAVARARAVAQRHQALDQQRHARILLPPRRAACRRRSPSARRRATRRSTRTATSGVIRDGEHAFSKDGGLAVLYGNLALDGCIVKTAGVDESNLEVRGAGEDLREPGRRGARHPQRRRRRRRRGGDPLRGPARRARHAGDAVSDQLSEIEGPRQSLRAGHRRPLLRRHLGAVDRPCLAGSGRGRGDRPRAEPATASASTFPAARSSCSCPTRSWRIVARRMEAKGKDAWKPAKPRKRKVTTALRAYAAFAQSAARGAVRVVP